MIGNLINNKINRQILSMLLTIALLAGLFPTAAFAQSSLPSIGVDGEIIAFEPLDDSISNQTVAFGTSLEDLALPDTLIATAEIIQPGAPEDTIRDSGKMIQENEVESGDEGGNLQLSSSEDTDISSVSQMTVFLPVKWEAEPIYDGNVPGEYFFKALAGDMLLGEDVQSPQIFIKVLAEAEEEITGGIITAFAPLDEGVRFQRGEKPILPKELDATVDGEAVAIPVNWESETNADEKGLHVFAARPDAAYSLGDGVPKPILSFYRTPMMQMRMMGGGNENSPLEITTEYQLAEIAALTNAGKLEEMVFGKGATKQVHIRLMNDLDIEGIDPKGDKSGWVPIGTWDDRFKGQFDGGGNIIKGLTIDRSDNDQGLFGVIGRDGTVSGLGLVDVSVKGRNDVGGLAGRIEFLSTVENCYVTGSVSGAEYIGGVVGYVSSGTLTNCYTTSFVNSTKYVGGVAGFDWSGSISNCAALNPSIIGSGDDVWRVGGSLNKNNYAFSGMMVNGNTVGDGGNKDGIGKTAVEIAADGTLFGLFTSENGWTTKNGFLPGLGGRTVEMPAHLLDNASPFSGGDGNSAETAYEITTPDQLAKLAELVNSGNDFAGKYFQLMNDLDLGDIDPKGDKTGWIPIGTWIPGALGGTDKPFSGVFDGKGHIVKNLTINRPSLNRVGLFGLVMGTNATIKNLGVVNATISGGGWTGGLVGINQGIVENCFVTGSIKGGETVGGVVGDVSTSGGIVRNCYSTALVIGTGGDYGGIGGVAGYAYSATIENCAALNPSVSGSVNGRRLVGQASGDINLINNYAFGDMMVDGNTVDNSDTNGEDKTAAEITADGTIFGLFTGENGWTTVNGSLPGLGGRRVEMPLHLLSDANPFSGGDGSNAENAYQITTANQLAKLAELVNDYTDDTKNGGKYADKYYGLMNDLDLRGFDPKGDKTGWIPIGTNDGSDKPFSGSFDGKGHIVKNLTINNSSLDRAGLFGLVMGTNATVKNIGVENVDISGGSWAGGLIGVNKGTLENSYVTGSIKGNKYVGGVVGDVSSSNGLVNNCYSSSNVKGADNVGGVAGYLGTGSTVTNCYSTGSVSATGSYGSAGGVVGTVNRTVKNCAALNPSVTTIGSAVGRVVGQNFGGTLSHNYAFLGMIGGGDDRNQDGLDGADMTASDAISPAFWTTDSNWETAIWDIEVWDIQAGKLPILKNAGGKQSGEPGLYLTPKSAENLTVTINGVYSYTGSLVIPDITVNFGDDTLAENQDYTWAITSSDGDGTSAGTNAGTVTIGVTGKGSYADSKTADFTINKAEQTVPATPTLSSKTTTSVMLNPVIGAEYRVDNGSWQASNIFAGLSPNTTYSLTIRLMGDANHEPSQASPELTVTTDKAAQGSGGGSHSGNNDSDDSYTTVTIIPTKQPDQPTIGSVIGKVKGTKTQATFTVTDSIIKVALQKAEAEAKTLNRSAYGVGAEIILNTSTATTLTITLERAALNRLVSSGAKGFELTGTPISMIYDTQALSELQRQGAGNITITVKLVTVKGVRNAYDITISYLKDGKMVSITNLGKGSVTISIPYVLDKNEAAGYLYAVYVDDMRKINRIDDSSYDANSDSVLFNTNHFSVYGVGYEVPSAKFTDITNHWAKDSIDYMVGRGLLAGTSKTTFAPDTAMTRGMLVTALGRLAGVDVKVYTGSSFVDVRADSTFRPYIEWAYKKGVVQGIGNEQFAPDRAVSREEIAVIFANFAKANGYKLPVTRTATAYADASSISNAYKTAITAMQQAGIMMGGTGNKFNPKASATRAEVSSMLHRYIKLTIDPATAQGWALNDAGQYLYYKDGRTLNGWQAIDGVMYYFNPGGTLKTSWVKDGNNWRFYSGNKALIGWWNIGNDSAKKTYYFTKDGLMISGKWLQIDGKWYYFYADGSLARSTKINEYEVDENGVRKTK